MSRVSVKQLRHLAAMLSLLFITTNLQIFASASLYVRAPVSGERVSQGEIIKVQWFQSEVSGAVNIQVWQANHGKWYELASGVDARLGEIPWQVPRTISGKCRIRVVSAHDETVEAYGRSFFYIEEEDTPGNLPQLQLTDDVVQLQPNPAAAKLNVSWPLDIAASALTVVDLLGNQLLHTQLDGQASFSVDVSAWAMGAYRVQLHDSAGQVWHSTLIIQR